MIDASRSKRRPFDSLIIMSQSRLAHRQHYAVDIVHDLTDAGIRIFHCSCASDRTAP
jgi:DNA invertase Pin-like site-specific DNA recombinase